MMTTILNSLNRTLSCDDFGKLLLRLVVGGLMLFHGLHKLFDGVDGISAMLVAKGLPGFIAYGVLVGEVVAPILLILGVLTRPAALVLAFTMAVAWLMVGSIKPPRWIKPGHGRLRAWSISLSRGWRLLFWARGNLRWAINRPGSNRLSRGRWRLNPPATIFAAAREPSVLRLVPSRCRYRRWRSNLG